jgi:hypothetical protein
MKAEDMTKNIKIIAVLATAVHKRRHLMRKASTFGQARFTNPVTSWMPAAKSTIHFKFLPQHCLIFTIIWTRR